MKRSYLDQETDNANFFIGKEIERTPAFGLYTLFVVGLQDVQKIHRIIDRHTGDESKRIQHIFFGANHSYNPNTNQEWDEWNHMIQHFLDQKYLCSLDIPISKVEEFNDGGLNEYHNFIPQIRVPIPYIRLWNYNTMLKIDDRDFNSTNPGIWTHSLHTLMNRNKFTDWNQYSNDEVIND